ncbi:MAG TPA: hypothetical protein VF950_28140 [Planctomycetota bacterium]
MTLDLARLEAALGRDARAYLQAQNPDLEASLSSDLEYLLQWHWKDRGLSNWRWFDGLTGMRIHVIASGRLDILGLMTWGETGNDTRQWVEVFRADLRVWNETLRSYTLRLGRRGEESRKIDLDQDKALQRELDAMSNQDWAYVFPVLRQSP